MEDEPVGGSGEMDPYQYEGYRPVWDNKSPYWKSRSDSGYENMDSRHMYEVE